MAQNASHDWFADCAENFVAYLFSSAGFNVYGGNKWGADLVVKKNKKWYLVEIRSTDAKDRPRKKSASKMQDVNIYAEVVLNQNMGCMTDLNFKKPQEMHCIRVRFCTVTKGERSGNYVSTCGDVVSQLP